MKHEAKIETQVISENRLCAYLSHEGFILKPLKFNTEIKIEVSGKGLSEAIRAFYANPKIPLFDYFRHFDMVREMIRGAK